jgi:hypothetical protein
VSQSVQAKEKERKKVKALPGGLAVLSSWSMVHKPWISILRLVVNVPAIQQEGRAF